MFIETETTPNPASLKFLPGQLVMSKGTREFATPETEIIVLDGEGAPLKHYTMDELLPDSFGPENLNRTSGMATTR